MGEQNRVAVIGAGVIGLSTALCIQERNPSLKVTMIAHKFGSETLSDGAGGLFRPTLSIDCDKEKLRRWCNDSLQHFYSIVSSEEAGVHLVPGYHLSSTSRPTCCNALLKEIFPDYRLLTSEEKKIFPAKYKDGIFYTTVVTDCRYYLPWLAKKFLKNGGKIEKKHIVKLSEISEAFDIIVNCTGLGAKDILEDDQIVPIRGQVIKVKAPWIKHFYYGDDVYIIPGQDYVTLGGVKDYGSWSLEINPHQKEFIWKTCTELVPSLKEAEFKWDWVGLRPYRPSVCLEPMIVHCGGRYMKVVNNYGHGGNGVTLSWGTAQEAAKLVEKLIDKDFLISRL